MFVAMPKATFTPQPCGAMRKPNGPYVNTKSFPNTRSPAKRFMSQIQEESRPGAIGVTGAGSVKQTVATTMQRNTPSRFRTATRALPPRHRKNVITSIRPTRINGKIATMACTVATTCSTYGKTFGKSRGSPSNAAIHNGSSSREGAAEYNRFRISNRGTSAALIAGMP